MLNISFWVWNIEEHKAADILTNGDSCLNHIIGLPKKNGEDNLHPNMVGTIVVS